LPLAKNKTSDDGNFISFLIVNPERESPIVMGKIHEKSSLFGGPLIVGFDANQPITIEPPVEAGLNVSDDPVYVEVVLAARADNHTGRIPIAQL
jgi:hypothetical protein